MLTSHPVLARDWKAYFGAWVHANLYITGSDPNPNPNPNSNSNPNPNPNPKLSAKLPNPMFQAL